MTNGKICINTSSRRFPECVVQLFFSHFAPKALHNAQFWAPTNLFSEVAEPTNTKRKFLTALRKLLTQVFVERPPQRLLNNANLSASVSAMACKLFPVISFISYPAPSWLQENGCVCILGVSLWAPFVSLANPELSSIIMKWASS